MGFLSSLFVKTEDPMVGVMREMVQMVKDQAQQSNDLVLKVLDVQKDQTETTRKLLEMYLSPGQNETIGLDQRLFNKEADVEWDPIFVGQDLFSQLSEGNS